MPYWWAYTPYLVVYLILCLSIWAFRSKFFVLTQISLFVIFALSLLYETFINHRRYLPQYVKENLINIVENVQKVEMPPFFRAFNPGVIPYKEGYLMVARCEETGLIEFINRKITSKKSTHLVLVFLDKKFTLIQDPIDIHTFPEEQHRDVAPEDPRVFLHKDKIYVCYNDCPKEYQNKKNVPRSMYLAELDCIDEKWGLAKVLELSFKRPEELEGVITKQVEKNWTPFSYEDQIHFIYAYDPLIVIKPDLNTGVCDKISYSAKLDFTKPYKSPRGGTPAYETQEGFLAFYHICNLDVEKKRFLGCSSYGIGGYLIGAVEISKEAPFQVIKKTKSLISGKDMYKKKKNIEYPSALILEEDRIILFWGREDREIMVGTINRQHLTDAMCAI
jgi:predicted GH43/DUF377 family glycosyl hydrolase